MKKTIVAFDVDGTLITNSSGLGKESLNVDAYHMLVLMSKMKNTQVIVWSGGGQDYAEQVVSKYGLGRYVERCFDKATYDETLHGRVDIAFDDQHEFSLADKNIIVRMK